MAGCGRAVVVAGSRVVAVHQLVHGSHAVLVPGGKAAVWIRPPPRAHNRKVVAVAEPLAWTTAMRLVGLGCLTDAIRDQLAFAPWECSFLGLSQVKLFNYQSDLLPAVCPRCLPQEAGYPQTFYKTFDPMDIAVRFSASETRLQKQRGCALRHQNRRSANPFNSDQSIQPRWVGPAQTLSHPRPHAVAESSTHSTLNQSIQLRWGWPSANPKG